jgi:phenylacetate-CoA ligase
VFQSPGPIYEPEGHGADYWRMARACFAAGFRAGDLVHNSFSYHLTPAGSMMESGAHGAGLHRLSRRRRQHRAAAAGDAELRPDAYAGTPSFLRILLEKAAEPAWRCPLTKALVSGEAFPPSLRDWLAERGIAAYQSYATADVGLIAYETRRARAWCSTRRDRRDRAPGHRRPGARRRGRRGGRHRAEPDYPLVRFGTGDLSAVLPGPCPTGRTNTRIKGWLGRADQTPRCAACSCTPARWPRCCGATPSWAAARLVVEGEMANDRMTLRAEVPRRPEGLAEAVAASVRDVTKLRGEVAAGARAACPTTAR